MMFAFDEETRQRVQGSSERFSGTGHARSCECFPHLDGLACGSQRLVPSLCPVAGLGEVSECCGQRLFILGTEENQAACNVYGFTIRVDGAVPVTEVHLVEC